MLENYSRGMVAIYTPIVHYIQPKVGSSGRGLIFIINGKRREGVGLKLERCILAGELLYIHITIYRWCLCMELSGKWHLDLQCCLTKHLI